VLKIFNPPLDFVLVDKLEILWQSAFGEDFVTDVPRSILIEKEVMPHKVDVYTQLIEENIVSSAVTIAGGCSPLLGGLGEVSTEPDFRGLGLATDICHKAVNDFFDSSGKALYLGTTNSAAARIYSKLGWKYIPHTQVMVNLSRGDIYEEFIDEYFSTVGPITFKPGEMSARIPMIPLAISYTDWALLDVNIGLLSTLKEEQESCLGIFRRYDQIRIDNRGEFFTLTGDHDRLLGISTAVTKDGNHYSIDGFTHPLHKGSFIELLRTALHWCEAAGGNDCKMEIAQDDQEKADLVAELGFKPTGEKSVFRGKNISLSTGVYTIK
tara:strand:- start:2249 stop:3220 length:972 start_codon:yes stop_codon:yes gene_type:complete